MTGRVGVALLLAALAAGCAVGVTARPAPDGGDATRKVVALQSTALNPRNGGLLIGADALRLGDILLSADLGIASAGIRLMTFSPVSHAALYVGDGRIAEAVGSGVRLRLMPAVLQEEAVVVAFRDPRVGAAEGRAIAEYALRQVGHRYDPLRLAQAADQVREKLVEGGFRGAAVEAIEPEACRKGHVDLVLKVEAGPKIVLTWAGDDIGEKARKRALQAWPPYASVKSRLYDARSRLRGLLQDLQGY